MTILLILLTLSLSEAANLDRTYLPPPETMFNASASSSSTVEDYLVPGEIQSTFPKTTDESISRNTSPAFLIRNNELGTMEQMQGEKIEEFKTESPTNHLKELSTPFFYNRFKVPEELLTNQNNEINQDTMYKDSEDSDKENYAIKSNKNDSHVTDKNDFKSSKANLNIVSSHPETNLQPQVQLLHPKYKTDVNIFSNDMVIDNDDILSTTEKDQVNNSTPSSTTTSFNPPFDMKDISVQIIPNNSINTRPPRPKSEVDRNAYILNYKNHVKSNTLAYSYDTSNGIHADQNGITAGGVRVQGSYSYTDDDGKLYKVVYTADENGFHPHGDHLPTPPPTPEAILKVIEQAAKDKEQGIFDDGSYDVNKYGDDKYHYGYKRHRLPNEKKGFVNGVDLPSENDLNYYFEDNANQHRSSGENKLATLRDSNVTEDSNEHILNEVVNKEKKNHGFQPAITNSLYKISVIDNNKIKLHKNKKVSADLINPTRTYHNDTVMIKTGSYMSKIDEENGYFYERPQKNFEILKTENAHANVEYGSSENGDINISVSHNSKIKNVITPNNTPDYKNTQEVKENKFKVPSEQVNTKSDTENLPKTDGKFYDNTFNVNHDFRDMIESFHPVTTVDLLQNRYTINTGTEKYNSLPKSTPLDDNFSISIESTESFTTHPSISIDESITSTALPFDKPNNEFSDNFKNISLKSLRPEYDGEEKYVDGYPRLNTIPFADGTETTLEHKNSECNKLDPTIFTSSLNEPTLPYYKNYGRKSPFVKIIGEDFVGPKQSTKYGSREKFL